MKKMVSLGDSDLNRASGGTNGDLLAHGILPVTDANGTPKFITVQKKDDGSFDVKEIDQEIVFSIMGSDQLVSKTIDNTGKEIYSAPLKRRQ